MIIESSANRFYRVEETGDASLAHVWYGIEVIQLPATGGWIVKPRARTMLVRKAATKVVEA